ncbi:TasA family protein [Blastococcus sp. URHD0036]|uniref:TasA family protein n=1 Tax=Blastococcus sp. URHD0036 TaxID=1380356 RepID=UPI000496FF50|nr:TasA family protein [Blastococcus sp. URHD0036]
MKKIAIASAAMGGAALIAFGASGTFAEFTDEAVSSSSAGAGTLVVTTTEDADTLVQSIQLAPGEKQRLAFPVQNGGTVDGLLTATGTVTEAEEMCESSDELVDGTCPDGPGQFAATADVDVYLIDGVAAEDCGDDTDVTGQANRTAGLKMTALNSSIPEHPLAAGDSTCIIVDVSLAPEVGNAVQGDSAALSVNLTLEQDTRAAV